VQWSVDAGQVSALAAGTYYGAIRITSANVADSPLDFVVVLNVKGAQTVPNPVPGVSGLVFTASGSQKVPLYAGSGSAVSYQASVFTTDGAGWLSVSPATGTAAAGSPGQSVVSVATQGLAPGVYTGSVSYTFGGAPVSTVGVTLIVGSAGACTASQTVVTETGLGQSFVKLAGWPVSLAVAVNDDCGHAVNAAQVLASFSNGDPPVLLAPLGTGSGLYSGTWTPQSVAAQVTVTTSAQAAGLLTGSAALTGSVLPGSAPILAPGASLHIFDALLGAGLAPGSIIQIYGTNLAAAAAGAGTLPLPTALGGTSVLIGGIAAPLYYVSPGQINAQIPFELAAGAAYQVEINAAGALSVPDVIELIPAAPGIAAFASGEIIAQHIDASLVTDSAPAQPGEYVVFYLAGMGATDVPVATGAVTPGQPLIHPQITPVLTLNGAAIPFSFAGLTPGSVGLYQIDFQVPQNTPNGLAAIIVSQQGAVSNTVLLPVHN
jgi:uncharacterized protein (TIGR03437 family)